MELVKEIVFVVLFYLIFAKLAIIWINNLFFSGIVLKSRPFIWILASGIIGFIIPFVSQFVSKSLWLPIILLGWTIFENRKPQHQNKEIEKSIEDVANEHYKSIGMKNWKTLRDIGWTFFLVCGISSIYIAYF